MKEQNALFEKISGDKTSLDCSSDIKLCSDLIFFAEMEKLWTFASDAKPFPLKDIKAALSEIEVG